MEPHMAKRMRKATIQWKNPVASDKAKPNGIGEELLLERWFLA